MTRDEPGNAARGRGMELRPFDVVLLGATGFTGRLIAQYLARHSGLSPHRWAIAGRSEDKLRTLRAELTSVNPACAQLSIVIADVDDPESLRAMAEQARAVITTVGPYGRHGDPVVEACILGGADYCDLTGEPGWYRSVVERFDARARARGVILVPSAGFESVPIDLGVAWVVERLPRGVPLQVDGYLAGWVSPSGGTLASALSILSGEQRRARKGERTAKDAKGAGGRAAALRPIPRWSKDVAAWVVSVPTIEPIVVARSAALQPELYGPDFRYVHAMEFGPLWRATGMLAGAAVLTVAAQSRMVRSFLQARRPQGTGPSEAARSKHWFRATVVGRGGGRKVSVEISGGDPGYDETAKIIAELGLCLAQDRIELPGRAGGVLTPAAACGASLIARLEASGLPFRLLDRTVDTPERSAA